MPYHVLTSALPLRWLAFVSSRKWCQRGLLTKQRLSNGVCMLAFLVGRVAPILGLVWGLGMILPDVRLRIAVSILANLTWSLLLMIVLHMTPRIACAGRYALIFNLFALASGVAIAAIEQALTRIGIASAAYIVLIPCLPWLRKQLIKRAAAAPIQISQSDGA